MTQRLARRDDLGLIPGEDPFVLAQGGFYRRWLSLVDDVEELRLAVSRLPGTTDDKWVPHWSSIARRHEDEGDRLTTAGRGEDALRAYRAAKNYYSLARFPGVLTPLKRKAQEDCLRAFAKSVAHEEPPVESVIVETAGGAIPCHYRSPASSSAESPGPAILVMCGADMFKEDRGWAAQLALDEGIAALVMDAPGTGENPYPHEPGSVVAWRAAIDWLAARPEVDALRIGAFGISRGGYSVMQLAGAYPEMVRAVIANGGHHFGYRMGPEEAAAFVAVRNARSQHVFGAPGDGPTFPPTTVEAEEELLDLWSLESLGLVDRIVCPLLMINGKHDHLNPVGNIYYMLEHGPATGREARIYADDGHCAPRHRHEWAPAALAWMAGKLAAR